jgi:hypothetical protein
MKHCLHCKKFFEFGDFEPIRSSLNEFLDSEEYCMNCLEELFEELENYVQTFIDLNDIK